jgi:2-phosphoglycolate phosphatase
MQTKPFNAVLFDLDGTLVDTAPDLVFAINKLRAERHLPSITLEMLRPTVSLGSKAMLKLALNLDESDKSFKQIREKFLAIYHEHLADQTRLFPGMEQVLQHLEQQGIPWGIVTNKPTRHSEALLKILHLDTRTACLVCGDTLATHKPDPKTILHACNLVQHSPNTCLYIGDAATDVIASKAAGTKSLVALYGYMTATDDPYTGQADGYVKTPVVILDWL